MIFSQIPPDVSLWSRLILLIFFLIWTRKKIAQNLRGKFGDANIMDEMISLQNIFALIAYLVLLFLFSYLWPLGWDVWKESIIFWPVQGLIILAVFGLFSLNKWYQAWFFFSFFLLSAVVLTVASIARDPRIIPIEITERDPISVSEIPMPVYQAESVPTYTTAEVETTQEPYNEPDKFEPEYHPVQETKNKPISVGPFIDTIYIPVPLGKYTERVYVPGGYEYQFDPLEEVLVETETGESFIQRHGEDLGKRSGSWRRYMSNCGHETKIRVIRKKVGGNSF